MQKIILYDPAMTTLNMGDLIIADAVQNYLKDLFPDAFFVKISTHMPVANEYLQNFLTADYRIACGTNLLKYGMKEKDRMWNIVTGNASLMAPVILMGVGWWQYQNKPDRYSERLYRALLSKQHIHSVRDAYTLSRLKDMGISNALNTACPTMWRFTPDFCADIPVQKANRVLTTLTDYAWDVEKDTEMLNILLKTYDRIYLWMQGYNEDVYFETLAPTDKCRIEIVPPSLNALDTLLEQEDIEYVGTRLHAGIRAMQHKKRTLIVAVDNRALEKKKDFNIPVIPREEIGRLHALITDPIRNETTIPQKAIDQFLDQFS